MRDTISEKCAETSQLSCRLRAQLRSSSGQKYRSEGHKRTCQGLGSFAFPMLRVTFLCVALLGVANARMLLTTDHLSQQKGDSNVRFAAHPLLPSCSCCPYMAYDHSSYTRLTHYWCCYRFFYHVSALCQQDWVLAMQKCQGASLWTLHGLWVSIAYWSEGAAGKRSGMKMWTCMR